MDELKFANGAVYDCSFLSVLPEGRAYIALSGVSFVEAAAIFTDPAMTSEIKCQEHKLIGFTELVSLYPQPYGIQALLRGGHIEEASAE